MIIYDRKTGCYWRIVKSAEKRLYLLIGKWETTEYEWITKEVLTSRLKSGRYEEVEY